MDLLYQFRGVFVPQEGQEGVHGKLGLPLNGISPFGAVIAGTGPSVDEPPAADSKLFYYSCMICGDMP